MQQSASLLTDAILKKVNLSFNTALGFFSCKNDTCGYYLQNWEKHLKRHNIYKLLTETDLAYFKTLQITYPLNPPAFPKADFIPIPGLVVNLGIQCGQCKKITSTKGSMAHHLSTDHRGKVIATEKVTYQRWLPIQLFKVNIFEKMEMKNINPNLNFRWRYKM